MGDVESAEEVAASSSPIRYQTFEDTYLRDGLGNLAQAQMENLPDISPAWLGILYSRFLSYLDMRTTLAAGKLWGVKCNGLIFLALHENFKDIPVQWVTTYRPLEDSLSSCFAKLGQNPHYAALLGVEYMAWSHLVEDKSHWEFAFDDMLYLPHLETRRLCRKLYGHDTRWRELANVINLQTKGVVPCHGSMQLSP